MSIRSFNHELFTVLQTKTALTSYYDKMKIVSGNECVPFGYMEDKKYTFKYMIDKDKILKDS